MVSIPLPGRRLRDFARDRAGTAAIEFAFVAFPFLLMLFAVIELALVFLLSTSLEAAGERASREIRTGQFQTASQTAANFKTKVCGGMTWLAGNCSTALSVDVRTYTSYSLVQPLSPVKTVDGKQVFDDAEIQFATNIPPSTIVVVRSYYKWPLISPLMNQGLVRLDGGIALVSSTQTFMTEPYQ